MKKPRLKVREIAESQGLTASKLARLTGLANETVYPIWRNESSPKIDTLQKIADALGVSVRDLIANGDDSKGQRKAGNAQPLTQQAYPATFRKAASIVPEEV